MSIETRLFTSESVASGHPDKLCDQVSDAVLDAVLAQDPQGRVACETFACDKDLIIVGGEIKTTATIDITTIVREVIKGIGYDNETKGLDYKTVEIEDRLKQQSPDIDIGVTATKDKEQGAGDQGHMFGFACRETRELMPAAIMAAHALAKRLEHARKQGILAYLRPDGKTQVTYEYGENGMPVRIHTIVVSAQHDDIGIEEVRAGIKEQVILPVVGNSIDDKTILYINPTGRFVTGGPAGDTGLTGRKIIVDTYGGGTLLYGARHGGGAFSGKDPSKVDRSAAYAARYIAKNIVAAGLADVCEVQLSYAIGVAQPLSVLVNTFGTGKIPDAELEAIAREIFPLKPADIIKHFELKQPIYLQTAVYGHFGKENLPWEKMDKAEALRDCSKVER